MKEAREEEQPQPMLEAHCRFIMASKQGDTNAMVEHARAMRELSPNEAIAYIQLSAALARNMQFKEALEVIRTGLLIEPQNPMLVQNEAAALGELGKIDDFEKGSLKALGLFHDRGMYSEAAEVARVLLNKAKSCQAIERATSYMIRFMKYLGREQEAQTFYRKQVEAHPDCHGLKELESSLDSSE